MDEQEIEKIKTPQKPKLDKLFSKRMLISYFIGLSLVALLIAAYYYFMIRYINGLV